MPALHATSQLALLVRLPYYLASVRTSRRCACQLVALCAPACRQSPVPTHVRAVHLSSAYPLHRLHAMQLLAISAKLLARTGLGLPHHLQVPRHQLHMWVEWRQLLPQCLLPPVLLRRCSL